MQPMSSTTSKPRRGRPSLSGDATPSQPLTVRLTERKFDRLFARASRDRTSLPAIVRRAVDRLLDDDHDDR